MYLSDKIKQFKALMIVVAIAIALGSLITSHRLTNALFDEEVGKMGVWAEAMRSLTAADEHTDLNLVLRVINSNNTIPVVVTDAHGTVLAWRNLMPAPQGDDSLHILNRATEKIKTSGHCMRMDLAEGEAANSAAHDYIYVYYEESVMLRRLTIYPYVQLGVIGFFVLVAFVALVASKRAEQNRVWVGLSRETAHQLGTPISSLMAWSEILKESYPDDDLLPEMDKDVRRLQLIAERFSKIGSAPEFTEEDLRLAISRVVDYLDRRTSRKVAISTHLPDTPVVVSLNAPLFEWVVENLCKNAVDAMQGAGSISISLTESVRGAVIEVSDTGKGIPHKHFKSVFHPGFTTKKRGWGLGLSLAKRIVEEYHHGKIYVKESEPGRGTTFAIELAKPKNALRQ